MGIITLQYATLLVLLLFSCMEKCQGALTFSCREDERIALLQFKASVNDSHGRLTSWVGRDCCSWSGVACDNSTNHVTRLDLGTDFGTGNDIDGHEINPCLLGLPKLSYLDLRSNIFNGAPFPKFIGSFKILSYLDLSFTDVAGRVPLELGNLSSLHHLDLSHNYGLEIEDTSCLSNLSSLEYLDLSGILIKKPSDALHSLGMLPVLSELHLASFSLTYIPRKLPSANFTSLRVLDLSYSSYFNTTLPKWPFEIVSLKNLDLSNNYFNGIVPSSMGNLVSLDLSYNEFLEKDSLNSAIAKLSTLTTLKLSSMKLKGQLPQWLGDLKNLEYLDLSTNNLSGTLPASLIGELNRLVVLDLSSNQLNGNLPANLGLLSRLVELDISENSFDGVATEMHFRNLINLKKLDLSGNSLAIDIKPEWIQPWQLEHLNLGECNVGPVFPAWLREMENISFISMSNVGISDGMPDWFWNFSLNISIIDMSNNMIKGRLPTSLRHLNNLVFLGMSNNQLEGQIPQLPTELEFLLLSNNLISRSIPRNIGEISSLTVFDASANKLSDSIPSSICKLKELVGLYLSHNQLSGQVPDCWGSLSMLTFIDLSNNNLSGSVPTSICSGSSLKRLHLNSNNLSGGIHLALRNCSTLEILDMGNNKLSGSIPSWLGRILTRLVILRLQSNMFVGKIPANLGNLSSLVDIDLSHNILSGSIPPSFANMSAMKDSVLTDSIYGAFSDTIDITIKGIEEDYRIKTINGKAINGKIINLPVTIDLSGNILSGEFPEILTVLYALQNLNLSRNNLTGKIPRTIHGLKNLESLDLSFNKLTGEIPSTMSTLAFLSAMNFSFNDLSGRIPTGGQFDSHPDPSIYMGNDHLCGFPLDSTCGGNLTHSPNLNTYSDAETDYEEIWSYASAALGFVTGFLALVGSLLLRRKWRIAYYRVIDHAYDKLYVNIVMNLFKICRIYDA